MIKIEHVGMFDRAVVNPMLTAQTATANYTIINDANGDAYLVINKFAGDNTYKDEIVVPAGEFLNGYLLKSLKGQNLVIEGKHIDGGIENAEVGDTLIVNEDGAFEIGETTGKNLYLVITDVDARLAEKAVKAKIVVASVAEESGNSNTEPAVNIISPASATFDLNESGENHKNLVFTVTPATSGVTVSKVYQQLGEEPNLSTDAEAPKVINDADIWSLDITGLVITMHPEVFHTSEAGTTFRGYALLTDNSIVGIEISVEDTTPVNTVSPATATYDLYSQGLNHTNKTFTVTPAAQGATISSLLDDEGDPVEATVGKDTLWELDNTGLILTISEDYLDAVGATIGAGNSYDMSIKLSDDSTVGISIAFENWAGD